MKGDHYTPEELDAEVRRLRFLYPDGQPWGQKLWLRWLLITDQEEWALTSAAWKRIKEEDTAAEKNEKWHRIMDQDKPK
jgi:hypothetical protein